MKAARRIHLRCSASCSLHDFPVQYLIIADPPSLLPYTQEPYLNRRFDQDNVWSRRSPLGLEEIGGSQRRDPGGEGPSRTREFTLFGKRLI